MSAKDVSNLQLRARQRLSPSLHPSALKLHQQLVGAGGVADQLGCSMGEARRRAQFAVCEQNLDHADVCPRFKKIGRKALTRDARCQRKC